MEGRTDAAIGDLELVWFVGCGFAVCGWSGQSRRGGDDGCEVLEVLERGGAVDGHDQRISMRAGTKPYLNAFALACHSLPTSTLIFTLL